MAENESGGRQISPWPWLIGLIVLAGFVWIMLTYVYIPEDNSGRTFKDYSFHSATHFIPPKDTINEVKEFINYLRDTSGTITSVNYTERGLIKLQSAISFVADNTDSTDSSISACIDFLDRTIAKIDTSSKNYLGELIPALSAAIRAIQSIQRVNFPGLSDDISNLKESEKRIDSKKSIGSQVTEIRNFFNEAGSTLQRMKLSYSYIPGRNSY